LVNSATFEITTIDYDIPAGSDIELQLTASAIQIYGATIKSNLKTPDGKACTCRSTSNIIKCFNVEEIK